MAGNLKLLLYQTQENCCIYQFVVDINQTYFEVVAPPIRSGNFIPILCISLATWIISSSDGVISPERPMISVKRIKNF